MFDRKIDPDDLRVLVTLCETAKEPDHERVLESVFAALYSKFARNKVSGTRQNPKWLRFSKMLAVGAFIDAAKLISPKGYHLYITGLEGERVICHLSTSCDKSEGAFTIADHRGCGKTIALAIAAASVRAHIACIESSIIKDRVSLATE